MLTDEYEIEKEFSVGESISEFKQNLEYFSGDYVLVDGRPNVLNSYKNPQRPVNSEEYWSEIESEPFDWSKQYAVGDFVSEGGYLYELKYIGYTPTTEPSEINTDYFVQVPVKEYSQQEAYYLGNKVIYRDVWFECMISNGVLSEDEDCFVVQPIIDQWSEFTDANSYDQFSESAIYNIGDKIEYNGLKYECVHPTDTSGMILTPDYTTLWVSVSYDEWDVSTDYSTQKLEETIVSHNSLSYQLYDLTGLTIGETPDLATDNWREVSIVNFDIEGRYLRSDQSGFDGFVEEEGNIYFVYEKNEKFVNFHEDESNFIFSPSEDPRNRNITLHMVNIVLYCLTTVAVPDNVPESRIKAYEKSTKWLQMASDFALDPAIPRKVITYEVCNDITGEVT